MIILIQEYYNHSRHSDQITNLSSELSSFHFQSFTIRIKLVNYSIDINIPVNVTGSNRRGKSGGLAWKQSGMWEKVNEFPKAKWRKYPQYTSEWWYVIMCKSNRSFIPVNDYSEFISLYSFAGMTGQLELRIITQPCSEVYCGYFRRLVFGNSLSKHIKPPCYHARPPYFPRLIGPVNVHHSSEASLSSAILAHRYVLAHFMLLKDLSAVAVDWQSE